MPYVEIEDFKAGMDARKPRVTGVPGSLFNLKNGHITRGGHIQRSKSFVERFVVPSGSSDCEATSDFSVTGGTTSAGVNKITSLKVASTELLGSSVDYNTTDTQTATDITTEINANTSGGLAHGYTATSSADRIIITSPTDSGVAENGKAVTAVVAGDLTLSGDGFANTVSAFINFETVDGGGDPIEIINPTQTAVQFGSPTISAAIFGDAGVFPGSARWRFPNTANSYHLGSGEFSVDFWVNFDIGSIGSWRGLVGTANIGIKNWRIVKQVDDTIAAQISVDNGSTFKTLATTTQVGSGSDIHIAMDRDASDVWRIYINGVPSASVTQAGTVSVTLASLLIGAADDVGGNMLKGKLDNIRVGKGTGSARYGGVDFSDQTPIDPKTTTDTTTTFADVVMSGGCAAGTGTFGMHGQGDNLFVFGGLAEPADIPSGVTYQRLPHKTDPNVVQITKILDTENFDGKIYAIAEFSDGAVFHYYDGSRISAWDDVAAAISSNATVAAALKAIIDLHPDFVATVATETVTIEAAVAGVGFTISANGQNFGAVNDQNIALAQTVANNAGTGEVLSIGTVTITGGEADQAAEGFFDIVDGTASAGVNKITSVLVDGVEVLVTSVDWATSHAATATAVAAQITSTTSSPNYNATASGDRVTITAADTGSSRNGFVVAVTPAGDVVVANVTNMSGGADNDITGIAVDGVSAITDPVPYNTSNSQTATDLATEIQGTTSSPNYTAAAVGNVVTITAIAGTGAGPNGFVVARTVDGTVTAGTTDMQGGITAAGTAKEKWDAVISGTFETQDIFTITLNGEDFVVQGAGSATGRTAITFKKKEYVTALSLLYFSAINNPTAWEQNPDGTSSIGAGFLNFANQDAGSEVLTGTGIFQGNLAVFSRGTIQIEFVDVDEEANTLLHTVRGTGSKAHRSIVQFGNNDLFYLDELNGIRSLRARDSSNAPSADDVGTPIDDHVLAYLDDDVTEQQAVDAWGLIGPDGRYWLAINERIYVFTFFKNSKVSAWSYYEPAIGPIEAMVRIHKDLFVRSGNKIYQYGGTAGTTYPIAGETPLVVEIPYLDLNKAAHHKTLEAFDFAALNTFDCEVLINPDDETQKSEAFTLTGTTYPAGRVGDLSLRSSHFAAKMVCSAAGKAELYSVVFHYHMDEAD